VLTATSLSYGEAKNSTPHRIKTPEPIEINLAQLITSTRGHVVQNFMEITPRGLLGKWVKYTQKLVIFTLNTPNDAVLHKEGPSVTNLSSDYCFLNYFFAHYFVLLVDI